MDRRYPRNGWVFGCELHSLRDRGLDRRGGYALIVKRWEKKRKFYVHQRLAEYVATVRRGSIIVLGGQICMHDGFMRYRVHRIAPATSVDEAAGNRALITGTINDPVVPATVGGRYRCSIPLLSARQKFVFIAYGEVARVAAGLEVGDEVALNMHFFADSVDPDDPDSNYRLRLHIDSIEVLPQ